MHSDHGVSHGLCAMVAKREGLWGGKKFTNNLRVCRLGAGGSQGGKVETRSGSMRLSGPDESVTLKAAR